MPPNERPRSALSPAIWLLPEARRAPRKAALRAFLPGQRVTPSATIARWSLPVPHLADDGDVGRHAEEAGDEAAEVDGGPVGSGRSGLHGGDVRQPEPLLRYM